MDEYQKITLTKKKNQKATYCIIPFLWHCGTGKTMGTENRFSRCQGLRGGEEIHYK